MCDDGCDRHAPVGGLDTDGVLLTAKSLTHTHTHTRHLFSPALAERMNILSICARTLPKILQRSTSTVTTYSLACAASSSLHSVFSFRSAPAMIRRAARPTADGVLVGRLFAHLLRVTTLRCHVGMVRHNVNLFSQTLALEPKKTVMTLGCRCTFLTSQKIARV